MGHEVLETRIERWGRLIEQPIAVNRLTDLGQRLLGFIATPPEAEE
jgi:hypothetical protein